MSVNKVFLLGNVGKDPEVKHFDNGSIASFPLATTERYRDRDGNLQERTEWHNIIVSGNTAKVVEDYVKKGTQLFIEGKIRTRKYQQNNQDKYITEIFTDRLELLSRPRTQDSTPAAPSQNSDSNIAPPSAAQDMSSFSESTDDLPF
ncbi:MAG TPA: single-stranded DNA-binding protein [Salinivirgaceae bacterium]|nr:single-stranded DNA-binding protein [Salinivirgaceae bacterium]